MKFFDDIIIHDFLIPMLDITFPHGMERLQTDQFPDFTPDLINYASLSDELQDGADSRCDLAGESCVILWRPTSYCLSPDEW